MRKRQIFVDLDGVLADFDGYYEKLFGVCPNQDTYEPPDMWDNIRAHGEFYRDLPMMKDALQLWMGIHRFDRKPVILTGVPWSIPNVAQQKREWVTEHLGKHVEMIACPSKDKCRYGMKGDILIDDRLKYAKYWTDMGGVLVHHTSNSSTLRQLANLCGSVQPPIV